MEISSSTVGVYTYDSQNRRTKKVAGGNTIQYVYGLDGLLYGEYTNAGVLIREYIYLDSEPLAQIDAGSPEVPTYLHPDHLGKPIYGTNSGGTQVWAANSDAFGVGTPSGSRTVNIRMAGQYYDSESGLFYNWNRYYNPATGRYISNDPIGIDGGLNTFLYVGASPIMYVDPEGLIWPSQERNPPKNNAPWGACARACASEFVDDTNIIVQGAVFGGATPIPKEYIDKPRLGKASPYTNPISYIGSLLESEPKLPNSVLGTRRICGALGRANVYAAQGLALYDSSALATCTLICVSKGGL